MTPTVSQQLRSISAAMTKAVIPALDPGDSFAAEQAGLILATLNWILDVHESEYPYELVENDEARTLLKRLAELDLSNVDAELAAEVAAAVPSCAAPGEAGTTPTLAALRDETRRFKELAQRAYVGLVESSPDLARWAGRLLLQAGRRQCRREQAWFRMTGFPTAVEGDVATVLAGAS